MIVGVGAAGFSLMASVARLVGVSRLAAVVVTDGTTMTVGDGRAVDAGVFLANIEAVQAEVVRNRTPMSQRKYAARTFIVTSK